jgi:hypothetical protein
MRRALLLALVATLVTPQAPAGEGDDPPAFITKGLSGWEGLIKEHWTYKGGELVGSTGPGGIKFNTFLCSKKKYRDFELKFKVRLKGGEGNSGVQIRSRVADAKTFAVAGPQCDIGEDYWGDLHGERFGGLMRRGRAEARKAVKPKEFNDYSIRVVGKRVTIKVNGVPSVDGEFEKLPGEGVIAFQLHSGGPIEVTFKDIAFKELGDKP